MTTYRESPKDSGNGPTVSMWSRSSGAAVRDVVRYGVGARMPFAIEHPEHGASSPTSWIRCCWAVAFSTLEWAWARETWKWLISNTLFYFCLGTIHQGRALLQSSHHSHSKQTQTLLPFPMLKINFSRQSQHPRCSSCKNYSYVMFRAQRGKLHDCTVQGKGSANVASAVFALACPPGITLVVRRDDPLLLRGNTRRPFSKWDPVLFRIISCFS